MYCNERAGANFIHTTGTSIRQISLEDIEKCNYFTLLMDWSIDSSFTEQELIYVLFLDSKGTPSVKFLSIENVKHAHADGLKTSILQAFESLKLTNLKKKLFTLNVDGVSVNTGIHRGLGVKIKEDVPWLMLIHCFNHRLELAMKDAFSGTLFGENNIMLRRCLDHSLDESSKQLTNFTKSLKQVTLTEIEEYKNTRKLLSNIIKQV